MRKIALVPQPISVIKRLLLHDSPDGVYLFGYDAVADSGCQWDLWFETVAEAEASAWEEYCVAAVDWQLIPDPLPDCQQDWIAPVRVKGKAEGNPQWGKFEKLLAGKWVAFSPPLSESIKAQGNAA